MSFKTICTLAALGLSLAGCASSGGSRPAASDYALKSVALSDGSTFEPRATPASDCATLKTEYARLQSLIGKDAQAFMARGKGEMSVYYYNIQIGEAFLLRGGETGCRD